MDEKQHMNQPGAPPPYPGLEAYAPPAGIPPPVQAGIPPPVQAGIPPPVQAPYPQPTYQNPMPHAGYAAVPQAPPQGANSTVIVQYQLGLSPTACVCPNCHQNIVTRTEYEVGLLTWLVVGIIFICGGWIFCLCFIPFCIDSLKDVRHVCSNCNHTIYYNKRM